MNFKYTYQQLSKDFHSNVEIENFPHAEIAIFNKKLANELNFPYKDKSQQQLLDILLGKKSLHTIAQAYAGHQYGHFTMLGDGRACLIGEYENNNQLYDFHLKGSGATTFSRGGDGYATLEAMLREYIISEYMSTLNIPTTRILAIIDTGEYIYRNTKHKSAIAVRIANNHIRIGTIEYASALGDEQLNELIDYTINRNNISYQNIENKAFAILEHIIDKQSLLVAKWLSIGFVHGVMNTDNILISGQTIDYGPCAFLDEYTPKKSFSSIDKPNRYAFTNQGGIMKWNIMRLAIALIDLISDDEKESVNIIQNYLDVFEGKFLNHKYKLFANKLGIYDFKDEDISIIDSLLKLMEKYKLDFTETFYSLTYSQLKLFNNDELKQWLDSWKNRISKNIEKSQQLMKLSNPIYIPRNHLVNEALDNANTDKLFSFKELLKVYENPFLFNDEYSKYMQKPTEDEKVTKTFCGT